MLTKELVLRIFSAANILRWNDHIRPFDLFELDKQAHKMIIAFVTACFEEDEGKKIDFIKLIEGGIFEFFQRIMLTDLKPEVYHELMLKKEKELHSWVIKDLESDLDALGCGIKDRFIEYFSNPRYAKTEKRILSAAHSLSTKWEFGVIYPWNAMLYGIEKTKEEIDEAVASYEDLSGIRKLIINKKYYGFIDLCGQLRFQQRWAQSFRIPKTTVLGHMLMVAIFSYIYSLEMGAGVTRLKNNFYSALFHDLPEILTKDIVSPVKSSIEGLENIIKMYEKKQVEEKILPLLPEGWRSKIQYYIEDEFADRIIENGKMKKVENIADFDDAKFDAVDGSLVEVCDKLCAYIEAATALEYGIRSETLIKSKQSLYNRFANAKKANLNFKQIFDYFK